MKKIVVWVIVALLGAVCWLVSILSRAVNKLWIVLLSERDKLRSKLEKWNSEDNLKKRGIGYHEERRKKWYQWLYPSVIWDNRRELLMIVVFSICIGLVKVIEQLKRFKNQWLRYAELKFV
jgi:hypothetical protein